MTDNNDIKKPSKFRAGLTIGAIIGGITAFFLAPKSGKENREDAKKKFEELKALMIEKEVDKKVIEIFGQLSEEAKELYLLAKDELAKRLSELKETVESMDKEKYMKVVEEVVQSFKTQGKGKSFNLDKLKKDLASQWEKLKKSEVKT